MSKSQKHIDTVFKEKLQNYEATPKSDLWANISEQLPQKKKKKRKVIPLWLPIGTAASLVFIFMLNKIIPESNEIAPVTIATDIEEICPEIDNSRIVELEKDTLKLDKVKWNSTLNNKGDEVAGTVLNTKEAKESKKETTSKTKTNGTAIVSNTQPINQNSSKGILEKRTEFKKENKIISKINKVNSPAIVGNKKRTILKAEGKKAIKINRKSNYKGDELVDADKKDLENDFKNKQQIIEEIQGPNKTKIADSEEKIKEASNSKKWSLQPQIAPLVYNSTSGNSTIVADFSTEVQFTETGLSYGVRVAYQASSKWQIRSGVSTAKVDLFIDQVSTNSSFSEFSSIQFDPSIVQFNDVLPVSDEVFTPPTQFEEPEEVPDSERIENPNLLENPKTPVKGSDNPAPEKTPNQPTTNDGKDRNGTLQQQISYIEIPVEFSYRLLDKRFGASVIGGFSAFILNQNNNQIFYEFEGSRSLIGSSSNINKTNFSGNFGIGLDYKITKDIKVSVEPIVKFQFGAFDSQTDYNPYIFGIYSGIKFNL